MEDQSAWDKFIAGLQTNAEKLQQEVITSASSGVTDGLKDIFSKGAEVVEGLGQSQSDVSKLSSFSDYIKKYIWVVPVVIIGLMLLAKVLFFRKKGGR